MINAESKEDEDQDEDTNNENETDDAVDDDDDFNFDEQAFLSESEKILARPAVQLINCTGLLLNLLLASVKETEEKSTNFFSIFSKKNLIVVCC